MKQFLYRAVFLFILFCSGHAYALTSGTTTIGTISTPGGISYQNFTVSAGDGVILYGYSSSYSVRIKVYKPDGSLWSSNLSRLSATAPATGTYNVEITANSPSSATGSYNLSYVQGGGSVSNGSLTSGQSYNGTLAINGLESFQFTGTAGQGVLLYIGAADSMFIQVYNPDGSHWSTQHNRFDGTLPATGTYTVVARANSVSFSGPYRLDYVRGAGNVADGTLISSSVRDGSLLENGLESYKFSAVASNNLSITSSASYSRYLQVYKPDGSHWMTKSGQLSATVPATGEYTLVLRGNAASYSGPYTVTLTTPPAPVAASTPSKIGAENTSCAAVQPTNEAGNPINFDAGFKKQIETDYESGGLTFSRIYRSDSTWTDNTIGALWRHNYARTLTFTSSTAAITDGTGATISYTSSGGNWVPDDPATAATFETAGSDYIYTRPDNTVEKYDTNNRLTRIEYLGGGALNLAYNGSGQLISVANENGRQLSMTYASNRVATMTTPDGAFAYSYDGNGNLEEVTRPDTKTTEYHYENGS